MLNREDDMKICVPSHDDAGLESTMFDHFGTAPYYTIVDVESGELEVMGNPDCHGAQHECHHAGHLKARGVDVVVSSGMGRRALSGLRDAGIRVLVVDTNRVADAVNAVKTGYAQPLSEDQACGGGHEGGHEGGCGEHGHHHEHGHGHGHHR
jgi:predicted Fe-Mo cluster-binding NifX family protein